jgi:hypothetical protein
MNAMGHSFPCSSFCVSTVAREWSEEKVYNKKSLVKYGLCKEGAASMVILDILKGLLFNRCPFKLNIFLYHPLKRFNNFKKYGTNLLTKLIFPKKDCMDLLLCGGGICIIALVHSRVHKNPIFRNNMPQQNFLLKQQRWSSWGLKRYCIFCIFQISTSDVWGDHPFVLNKW